MTIEPDEIAEGEFRPVEDGVGDEDQFVEPEAKGLDLAGLLGKAKAALLNRLYDLTRKAPTTDEPEEFLEPEAAPAPINLTNVDTDQLRRSMGAYFNRFRR